MDRSIIRENQALLVLPMVIVETAVAMAEVGNTVSTIYRYEFQKTLHNPVMLTDRRHFVKVILGDWKNVG